MEPDDRGEHAEAQCLADEEIRSRLAHAVTVPASNLPAS
jgi:hypothetical protein